MKDGYQRSGIQGTISQTTTLLRFDLNEILDLNPKSDAIIDETFVGAKEGMSTFCMWE